MKIAEIQKLKKNNAESIILHHEGLFWRAYEQSAYRFVTHIKQYQIKKKYIKSVKNDIVYCGFPQNALNNILCLVENHNIDKSEKQIVITGFETENRAFEEWKNKLSDEQLPESSQLSGSLPNNENILNRIRNFT